MTEWGPQLAIILGIVEGLTEYLPVSSTGHLILVGHALGFTGEVASSVEISIQLGAIFAVIVYEWEKITHLAKGALREKLELLSLIAANPESSKMAILTRSFSTHRNFWFVIGLGLAFIPAALVGFISHGWIKAHLFNPPTVATSLIVGGVILLAVEGLKRPPVIQQLDQVPPTTAFWVGVAQCASLIPGVSRSGATIVGGLLVGMDRKVSTEYSFFLALPTLMAATVYQFWKSHEAMSQSDLIALGIGTVVSFFTAWAVIALFLNFVKRHTLRAFAYYRILLGFLVLWIAL